MFKKKKLGLGIIAIFGAILAGCNNETADANIAEEVVRIAVAAPLTGDNAEYGQGFLNAVNMQAAEWNERGGVLGMDIEVVPFDDRNASEEAASIAQRIASDGNFVGVIGHFSSGVAMTAAPTYNENGIINISPSAGHPDFTTIGEYIFRNNALVGVEAAAMLDVAVNHLGKTNIGILSIMTDWGVTASSVFHELVEALGSDVQIVAHEEVMEASNDFSPAITNLEAAGAEVIITVSMHSTLAPFARQYRQVNPDIQLIAFSNAYSHQLIELGGDATEGILFPVSLFAGSTDPVVSDYVARFTQQFGAEPSSLTSQAFDAAGMLFAAVEEAGTTDASVVRDVLADLVYTGVMGDIYFDELGNVIREFTIVTIENGEFVQVQKDW